MIDAFLNTHIDQMEDFWRRKVTEGMIGLQYVAYGYRVFFKGNVAELLESANLSAGRYSHDEIISEDIIDITIIQDSRLGNVPVPDNFTEKLQYQAINDSILIWGFPWVFVSADLENRTAIAIVSPSLVKTPVYLSRFVIDTVILNILIHTGVGQLHASCLVYDRQVLLLSASHNSGKSTTAYWLVRNGYQLLSDGMTFVREIDEGFSFMGYPVGELKLRLDVLEELPELYRYGKPVLVREATKMVYNLRHAVPENVIDTAVCPEVIKLCLLERDSIGESRIYPLSKEEAIKGVWESAAHYDDREVLSRNISTLWKMIEYAECYRLVIGTNKKEMVRVIDSIWDSED